MDFSNVDLNIDLDSVRPYVIDAFTATYGEEYRAINSQKINNAILIQYHDVEGLSDYVSYIKRCKSRELAIQFLDKIGMDVEKYRKTNYTEPLDSDIENIISNFLDSSTIGFSEAADTFAPLRAFNSNNNTKKERILRNKIKLINYLLGDEHEQITEENFEAFTETKKYSELLETINQYNIIYEELLSEYNEWSKQLKPLTEYVEFEGKRKSDILQKKKNEMFSSILPQLPLAVRNAISNKALENQIYNILGYFDIGFASIIEFFGQEQMNKLKSNSVSPGEKYLIVASQSAYLKELGITIPDENMLKCESEEDISN
ncbi:MAG: hypothetical protein K2I72_01910, partial [Bacilli bacterium]|nr:hypothetical protein [Bacilli bacterium]